MSEDTWPNGYDGHSMEQRKRIWETTTPEQRLQWLEEMLFMLWENGLLPSKLPDNEVATQPHQTP